MLFAPLLLYFPRFLSDTETQPLLAIILCAAAFVFGRDRVRSLYLLLAVSFALAVLLVMQSATLGFLFFSVSSFQLLFGPLFLFGIFAARPPPPSRLAIKIVAASVAAIVVFELILPGAHEVAADLLLSRISTAGSHRGVSVLTPEPTYAAITISYLLVLSLWSRRNERDGRIWPEVVFLSTLCATLSTYAFVLLVVFAAGWLLQSRGRALFGGVGMTAAALLLWVFFAEPIAATRAFVAIQNLVYADGVSLVAFAEADPSFGVRLFSTWASILTPLVQPQGFGLECHSLSRAIDALEIVEAYWNEVLVQMLGVSCLKPPAYVPALMLSLGALAFAFAGVCATCIVFLYRSRPNRQIWWTPFWLAMLMIFVQGQISNPIPWFLLFIALTARANQSDDRMKMGR